MEFNVEMFIEAVRDREFLYNPRLEKFKNRNVKDKAWAEIGHQFNMHGQECEKKWQNLRDTFTREGKKAREGTKSGAGARKVAPWYLAGAVSFMRNFVTEPRTSTTNFCSEISSCGGEPSFPTLEEGNVQFTYSEDEELTPSPPISPPIHTTNNKRGKVLTRGGIRQQSTSTSSTELTSSDLPRRGVSVRGGLSSSGTCRQSSSPSAELQERPLVTYVKPRKRAEMETVSTADVLAAIRADEPKGFSSNEHFCLSIAPAMDRMSIREQTELKKLILDFICEKEGEP